MARNKLLALLRDLLFPTVNVLARMFGFSLTQMLQPPPPTIKSRGALLSEGAPGQHQLAGTLFPCPRVCAYLHTGVKTSILFDSVIARNGFTLIFIGDSTTATKIMDSEPIFLLKLRTHYVSVNTGIASKIHSRCSSFRPRKTKGEINHFGSFEAPIEVDADEIFKAWIQRNQLEETIILLRPDRYIFGVYSTTQYSIGSIARTAKMALFPSGSTCAEKSTRPAQEHIDL